MAIVLTIDYMEDLILETAVERSLEIFLFFYHMFEPKCVRRATVPKCPSHRRKKNFSAQYGPRQPEVNTLIDSRDQS